jgi:peptidoglycan/LPS O-acetylase OafA/YrhL
MTFIRKASAFATLGLGSLLILVAYANLYNIDEQPRSVLVAYALAGVLLIAAGVTLLFRSRRRSSPRPPAL